MEQQAEKDLIEDFHREGSSMTLRFIYKTWYRGLVFYAMRLLKNEDDAEDIVQESIIKLLKKKHDFDNLADIQAFLYVSTRNACFNYITVKNRHDKSHQEIKYLSAQQEWENAADIEMLRVAAIEAIYKQIERLPTQCRTIFKLHYINRLNAQQIAEQLGIAHKTVLNQRSLALKLLQSNIFKTGMLFGWMAYCCDMISPLFFVSI